MHSANLSLESIGNELASQSDLRLVRTARAGSEVAFAELHRLYAHRLYRIIFAITKNHEDAEDALQNALLRAYLALGTFEGRSKLFSWLTRIAINSALMTLRKRRTSRETTFESLSSSEDEVPQFQVKDPSPNPEESCLQLERTRSMARAMTKLEPALRDVIQLQMSRECSMKELARSLDVSVAAVKARLHRARRRIALRTHKEARMKLRTSVAMQKTPDLNGGNGNNHA
jgi:RNA polymerase sigma-70 factor (ECF subfamily)